MRHCRDGVNRPEIEQLSPQPTQRQLGKQGDKKAREKRKTEYHPERFAKYDPTQEFNVQSFIQSL